MYVRKKYPTYYGLFLLNKTHVSLSFSASTHTSLVTMSDSKDDKGDEEKVFGGCEGPDAMYVKLVSSDGHEFIVKRDHALTSGTIKAMLSGPGKNV